MIALRLAGACLLLAAAAVAGGCAAAGPDRSIEEVDRLHESDPQAARRAYQELIRRGGRAGAEAARRLAEIYVRERAWPLALHAYSTAIAGSASGDGVADDLRAGLEATARAYRAALVQEGYAKLIRGDLEGACAAFFAALGDAPPLGAAGRGGAAKLAEARAGLEAGAARLLDRAAGDPRRRRAALALLVRFEPALPPSSPVRLRLAAARARAAQVHLAIASAAARLPGARLLHLALARGHGAAVDPSDAERALTPLTVAAPDVKVRFAEEPPPEGATELAAEIEGRLAEGPPAAGATALPVTVRVERLASATELWVETDVFSEPAEVLSHRAPVLVEPPRPIYEEVRRHDGEGREVGVERRIIGFTEPVRRDEPRYRTETRRKTERRFFRRESVEARGTLRAEWHGRTLERPLDLIEKDEDAADAPLAAAPEVRAALRSEVARKAAEAVRALVADLRAERAADWVARARAAGRAGDVRSVEHAFVAAARLGRAAEAEGWFEARWGIPPGELAALIGARR